jgi:predicted Fe-Mo cluster-binding NifX family protein
LKVALAVQREAVCPRLDCARELLVLGIRGQVVHSREVLDIQDWPTRGRAARLASLGIELLVCGGLCPFDEAGFDASGVRLMQAVSGPVEAVIRAICSGTIEACRDYWQEGGGSGRSRT